MNCRFKRGRVGRPKPEEICQSCQKPFTDPSHKKVVPPTAPTETVPPEAPAAPDPEPVIAAQPVMRPVVSEDSLTDEDLRVAGITPVSQVVPNPYQGSKTIEAWAKQFKDQTPSGDW